MKIKDLLLHAYGMGGTIRTVNQANAMVAAKYDVDIVSAAAPQDHPAPDRSCPSSATTSARAWSTPGARAVPAAAYGSCPAGSFAVSYFTPAVERATVSFLSGRAGGRHPGHHQARAQHQGGALRGRRD